MQDSRPGCLTGWKPVLLSGRNEGADTGHEGGNLAEEGLADAEAPEDAAGGDGFGFPDFAELRQHNGGGEGAGKPGYDEDDRQRGEQLNMHQPQMEFGRCMFGNEGADEHAAHH